jgi:hypothetical protein
MTDLNKYLKMLKSPKADTRYDACEELRVATESSPEVVLALVVATRDENKDVAERAKQALITDVHQQIADENGIALPAIEEKQKPEVEPESEQPARKTNQLAITSLVFGIIGLFLIAFNLLFIMALSNTGATPPDELFIASLFAEFLFGISGLLVGILALRQIKKEANAEGGKWIAITGIILGVVNFLPVLLLLSFVYFRPIVG